MKLAEIIRDNESWLVKQILFYAKRQDYTRYTSTLEAAWQFSIRGLSESLTKTLNTCREIPDFGPDDQFEGDPLTEFGRIESQRHRKRGVTLAMFLSLMKYCKQCYVDLLEAHLDQVDDPQFCRLFIERSFDRIEIAFCAAWADDSSPLIDDLRKTTRSMTNEKNAYLTSFESLSDAVIMLDIDENILQMNHAASLLSNPDHIPRTQYHSSDTEREEIEKQFWPGPLYQKSPLADLFPWLKIDLDANPNHSSSQTKIVETTLNEKKKVFEVKHSPMLDVSEKYTAHILTLRDITERQAFERRLAKRNLEIERLRHLESLGVLSEGIAHDIGNLLAVIASRTRTLKKQLHNDSKHTDGIEHILGAVDKMTQLTKTMRDCSGKDLGRTTPHDINQIINRWYKDALAKLPALVNVDIDQTPNLPHINAAGDRLAVVLTNLLDNAIESLGERGGRIAIHTGMASMAQTDGYQTIYLNEMDEDQCIFFEIEDNGSGIDEKILPKIFDPFFTTKFIGRGLGLSAVRGVVAAHGGAVRIRTLKGIGSSFQVLLPFNIATTNLPHIEKAEA